MLPKASKQKVKSQAVAELKATWTGHIWNMAISSNSIQRSKNGTHYDLVLLKKKVALRYKEVAPTHMHV